MSTFLTPQIKSQGKCLFPVKKLLLDLRLLSRNDED